MAARLLRLDMKRLALLAGIWILSVVLHNAIDHFTGVEEPIFFILAVIAIPLYGAVSLLYTIALSCHRYRK
jgi:hypothetical protein